MGIFELPESYAEIRRVNLQNDKKLVVIIHVVWLIMAISLTLLGLAITPLSFGITINSISTLLMIIIALLIAVVAYVFAHELTHGIFIKKYSGKKAKYGFTGLYAYASSDAYFNKRQYLTILLAPIILFGAVFLVLNIFLPLQWFWFIYFLQILNFSGAAGDLYITYLMRKVPADVLIHDEGFNMIFYSRKMLN